MRVLPGVVAVLGLLLAAPLSRAQSSLEESLAKMAGTWQVVATSGHGKVVVAEGSTGHDGRPLWADTVFTIAGDVLKTKLEPVVLPQSRPDVGLFFAIRTDPGEYRLRLLPAPKVGPAPIDLIVGDGVILKGIYEFQGNELKLCVVNWLAVNNTNKQVMIQMAERRPRPTSFKTTTGGGYVSYVLKRGPPEEGKPPE